MPFVTVDGVRLHAISVGSGSPVVLVHTVFTGTSATWLQACGAELSAEHEVLAYDLRGHGLSERSVRGYDIDTTVADLDAVTAHLPPFALVGEGWGAQIAARFALAHSDRVSRLALVELPIVPPTGPAPASTAGERRLGRGARQMITELVSLTTVLDDLLAEPSLTDSDLRELQPPTRCVFGADGGGRAAVERVVRARPGADALVIDGTAEVTSSTSSRELAWALVEFLDDRRDPSEADRPVSRVPRPRRHGRQRTHLATHAAHPTLVFDDEGRLVSLDDVVDRREPRTEPTRHRSAPRSSS